jgi:phosphotransferase system HPr-like phosphotransfer protein
MKFETKFSDVNNWVIVFDKDGEMKKQYIRERVTARDIGSIMGLDMQDGSAIRISRESWKRLEVFMALLSGVEMSISEETLRAILEKASVK